MIIVPDSRYFAEQVKADLAPTLFVHRRTKLAQDIFQSSGFLTMLQQVRGKLRFLRFGQKLGINKNRTQMPRSDCNPFFPFQTSILKIPTCHGQCDGAQ